MLEYGIKTVVTNPTLITKSDEAIRLIDSRTKKVRAFVIPAKYAKEVEKLLKEIEYKEWVKKKKKLLKGKKSNEDLSDVMEAGIESINEYLDEQ